MNILQITLNACSEARVNFADGVARVVTQLSSYLTNVAHDTCFLGYFADDYPKQTVVLPVFTDSIHLSYPIHKSELMDFIVTNKIEVIQINLPISNTTASIVQTISEVAHYSNVKVVFCLHVMPDFAGKMYGSFGKNIFNFISQKFSTEDVTNWIVSSTSSINNWIFKHILKRKYKIFYDCDDKVVVFSGSYAESYRKIIKHQNGDKLSVIPNPLSFSAFFPKEEIQNKTKEVILIGRLVEYQKRISYALKIWQIIEKNPLLQDWRLTIVGDGKDEAFLLWLANKYHLKSVFFEGRQDPIPYYNRASIMMMTSGYEGWPMVMMEAMPMGCCCISFDSFGAINDIIEDGYNGCIVPNNNIKKYAKCLSELMLDDKKRITMGVNAIESSKRFTLEKIGEQWHKLFEEMTE